MQLDGYHHHYGELLQAVGQIGVQPRYAHEGGLLPMRHLSIGILGQVKERYNRVTVCIYDRPYLSRIETGYPYIPAESDPSPAACLPQ